MYSVLILNQKSTEAFSHYQSLFRDAIEQGEVGVCLWDETGTTVDTALPDLHQLTDDKKEWQAIIVRTEREECEHMLPADAKNPYDFFNGERGLEEPWAESANPLIRLTHILGGAPSLEKKFKKTTVPATEDRSEYVIFEPDERPEEAAMHRAFREKYEYDGVEPSEIFIISARLVHKFDEGEGVSPKEEDDLKSSMFWRRNRYPGICRFIVCDYAKSGPVQETADQFRFWLLVRLLATNYIDPAFIQGYRLYRGSLEVDPAAMTESFRETADRLNSTKRGLTFAIQRDAQTMESRDGAYPDITVDTPVDVKTIHKSNATVKTGSFDLFSRGASPEITVWENGCREAEKKVLRNVQLADRELDRAAEKTKMINTFPDTEVGRLDKYQREDLEAETDELYERVIEMQGALPTGRDILDSDLGGSENRVRRFLQERVGFSPLLYTLMFVLLLIGGSCIPALVRSRGTSVAWNLIGTGALVILAAAVLCCGLSLLIQKLELNAMIRSFNHRIEMGLSRISSNAEVYADYLKALTAHSRGRSYLEKSARKERGDGGLQELRYQHIDALNNYLTRMEQWAAAFHLDVDFFRLGTTRDVDLDVMIQPGKNTAYRISSEEDHPIEINWSGMMIYSPFPFIRRIELAREELYEENREERYDDDGDQ